MGKLRARELGFDACMYMLHKTFGAPKGGGGPAVGAYGCSAELAPFLPAPVVVEEGGRYRLDQDRPRSAGKVREFWGNVPQVVKAYAWAVGMGGDGIAEAADLSVLANNYMDTSSPRSRGLARSHPDNRRWRMEMTRWGLGPLKEATGIGTVEVANRMADYGVDPWWMSHEPWVVPEPFTPEAGEMCRKEDIDYWIAVVRRSARRRYATPSWSGPPRTASRSPRSTAAAARRSRALGDDLAGLATQASGCPRPGNSSPADVPERERAPLPVNAARDNPRRF